MKTLIWIIAIIMIIAFGVFGLGISLEIILGILAFLLFLLAMALFLPDSKVKRFIENIL